MTTRDASIYLQRKERGLNPEGGQCNGFNKAYLINVEILKISRV
jgi:hypothetical protein